jgi:predicted nucleotidyltransferase
MVKRETLRKDFSFLIKREDVLAVLLFGSHARLEQDARSDVDICEVAPSCKDRLELLREIHKNLDVYGKNYDVRIFEDLPLYINRCDGVK